MLYLVLASTRQGLLARGGSGRIIDQDCHNSVMADTPLVAETCRPCINWRGQSHRMCGLAYLWVISRGNKVVSTCCYCSRLIRSADLFCTLQSAKYLRNWRRLYKADAANMCWWGLGTGRGLIVTPQLAAFDKKSKNNISQDRAFAYNVFLLSKILTYNYKLTNLLEVNNVIWTST